MTLPRVLVIDDQYARPAESLTFLNQVGAVELGDTSSHRDDALIAEVRFCSGQRIDGSQVVNDLDVARKVALEGGWSLVLLDLRFDSGRIGPEGAPIGRPGDGEFGDSIRRLLAAEFQSLPIVVFSTSSHEELPDRDLPYLSKIGLNSVELRIKLLEHGILTRQQSNALLRLPAEVSVESAALRQVFTQALRFGNADSPVLLLGPTGVGKEVVARYIHESSPRANGSFVGTDIATVPPELISTHLFGHTKGAFTDAKAAEKGVLELANGGTLFLDEIGELPVEGQEKLLRALETGSFRRVGSSSETRFDLRLISATQRDLAGRVFAGAFREDFLHRINALTLRIPSLQERREDILPLARLFLAQNLAKSGKVGIVISREAEQLLEDHVFRGNVRELRNAITRLVALSGNNAWISGKTLREALGRDWTASAPQPSRLRPLEKPEPESVASLGLNQILDAIKRVRVGANDRAWEGLKPILDQAYRALLRKLAAAALDRCRDPLTLRINRQAAMQLLTGDRQLKGQGPRRLLNEILERPQNSDLSDQELETLIRESLPAKDP